VRGIPAAIRDRIFRAFFSTKQFGTGSGLGLSMVFGFAEAIRRQRRRVQRGRKRGNLPDLPTRKAEDAISAQTALADVEESRGGSRPSCASATISSANWCHFAFSGPRLYRDIGPECDRGSRPRQSTGTAFDLLFTDIVMPGSMNGRQLAEKIAGLRRPLRVLYTSGNTLGAFNSDIGPSEGLLLLTKPYLQGGSGPDGASRPRSADRSCRRSDSDALLGIAGRRTLSG
jgi:CheY-like chemotaxis protein